MTDTAPPVSFEGFVADLLAPWASEEPLTADTQAGSPKAVAMQALYRALLCEGEGIILVIAPASEHRTIAAYLQAMTEGHTVLAGMDRCISVVSHERAPLMKGVTFTIELSARAADTATPSWADDGFTLGRKLIHVVADTCERDGDQTAIAQLGHLLGLGLANWYWEHKRESARRRETPEDRARALPSGTTQAMYLLPPPEKKPRDELRDVRIGEDGYFTPEHERWLMEQHTAHRPVQQTRAVTGSLYRGHGGSAREQRR